MGIKSIKIKNLLSFKDLMINDFSDINCVIGKNNVGKSNLLKIINFFYNCLDGNFSSPPDLHSNYSSYGEITIIFNTKRLEEVVRSTRGKSPYQKHMYKTLFKSELNQWEYISQKTKQKDYFSLTLKINKNHSISWSDKDKNVRDIIYRIYPFLAIDTRRLDLYNWKDVWVMVSKLKFLNTKKLSRESLIDFIDDRVSSKSNSYKDYVEIIRGITKAAPYDYQDLILNYIKVGLEGHTFNINGYNLDTQSDGTNSHKFLEIFLHLVISLTRREFITPTIFIDEPEIGLHPKRNEELIENLHNLYRSLKNETTERQLGKYKTPYPIIIFATHSPNILKTTIRLFSKKDEHRIFHFCITKHNDTTCTIMKSHFVDGRFINIFNDNEARLFFSSFILFVEGETELELFGNVQLKKLFPVLNKIDIYKTNEVMLNAINPSKSNVSIPYLVLYDADKMLTVNVKTGAISFTRKEVDLLGIRDKYVSSYWGSKQFEYKRKINNILSIHEKPSQLSVNKTSFSKISIDNLMVRVNRIITESERMVIAPTTTEGYLINGKSRNLFIKWIIKEFNENTHIGTKGDPNIIINSYLSKYPNINMIRCFNEIFGHHILKHTITNTNNSFAELVKKDFIKNVVREIIKCGISKEDKLIILRLAFEGKSDTLCSKENKNYTLIDQKIRDLVTILETNIIKKLPCGGTKTGGWVTSFLNFAIQYFYNSSKSDFDVKSQFKRAFPEIYSIIIDVSSSIE